MTEPVGLEAWGWSAELARAQQEAGREKENPGRVIAEHAGLFRVRLADETVLARPTGKLRARIEESPELRPVVGDWVTVGAVQRGETSLGAVLPRRSFIARKDPDGVVVQPIVSNIDKVLVVTALTGDVNPRRLERYLSVIHESGAEPIIVLTKVDLAPDADELIASVREVAVASKVLALSPKTGLGVDALNAELHAGETVALIGSSGVGKSTLINRWLGNEKLAVGAVDDLGKGKHTTTARQLIRLPSGVMVIDTPGMRELALWDAGEGVEKAFDDIEELAQSCRFRDCRHVSEPGCAVRAAVERGEISQERLDGFHKLSAEVDRLAGQQDALKRAQKKAADKSQARALEARLREKKKK